MSKKIIAILMSLTIVILLFSGCKDKSKNNIGDVSSNIKSEQTDGNGNINPFTGETGYSEELLTTRPVAVMVNNLKQALPQRGISKADIIYEYPVEGGITRLMAVFSDYKNMPEIGSIRSARHDYVETLLPLNAIYLHFGGSIPGYEAISKYKVDDIDGVSYSSTAFRFDSERAKTKSREHCFFSNGELLQKGIDAKKINTKLDSPLNKLFNFVSADKDAMENASGTATSVSVESSGYCKSKFVYDEATKKYKKQQFGEDHIDETTGSACEVKNVFIMYTSVKDYPDEAMAKLREIDLSKGEGLYLSNGKYKEVRFEKNDVTSMFKVYDSNNQEVEVNVGQTWFTIIPDTNKNKTVVQ